jgi:hypothetical protein
MAAVTLQGSVCDYEVVVEIAMHSRHVIAPPAVLENSGMTAQCREELWHLLVPLRNVDPHETVVAVEQGQQCVAVMLMSSRGVYESDVHVASVSQSFCPVKKHGTGHANATLCDPPSMSARCC